MNDITVMISGMILLMAPVAYIPNGSKAIHAAVAVNGTDPRSTYGVDIPQHVAALIFSNTNLGTAADVGKPYDPGKRLIPDEEAPNKTRVELHGDLVQLGTWDGAHCTAIIDNPAVGSATITDSIRELPRMVDLVDDLSLEPDTYPSNGVYSGIEPKKVSGWLEIPSGRVFALHSDHQQDDEVTFRPIHRNAMVAKAVQWRIQGKADCVLVTPFGASSRVEVPFKPGKVSVTYQNMADMDSGEVIPGIDFDFEVLYNLFTNKPKLPPLPYSANLPVRDHTPVNGNTGVNCGPATVPSGG